jgi:hypothetical protein
MCLLLWVLSWTQKIASAVLEDDRCLGCGSSFAEILPFLDWADHLNVYLTFIFKCILSNFVLPGFMQNTYYPIMSAISQWVNYYKNVCTTMQLFSISAEGRNTCQCLCFFLSLCYKISSSIPSYIHGQIWWGRHIIDWWSSWLIWNP